MLPLPLGRAGLLKRTSLSVNSRLSEIIHYAHTVLRRGLCLVFRTIKRAWRKQKIQSSKQGKDPKLNNGIDVGFTCLLK